MYSAVHKGRNYEYKVWYLTSEKRKNRIMGGVYCGKQANSIFCEMRATYCSQYEICIFGDRGAFKKMG